MKFLVVALIAGELALLVHYTPQYEAWLSRGPQPPITNSPSVELDLALKLRSLTVDLAQRDLEIHRLEAEAHDRAVEVHILQDSCR